MFYSESDKANCKKMLIKRLLCALAILLIPQIPAFILMYTSRSLVLSSFLSCLGIAGMLFYWGFCLSPVIAYLRYLNEILGGRNHEFTARLIEKGDEAQRDGVKTVALSFVDEGGDERLCYIDEIMLPKCTLTPGENYAITVHGQSILSLNLL